MIQIDNLPAALRESGLFCCWRYEERDGKRTKVPYNPKTGGRAQSTNPDTFAPLMTAMQRSGYDGIGVGIFGTLGAIDIDHCIDDNGEVSEMALDVVNTMRGYTEVSPSGKGLRILFYADGFQYDKARYYINNQKAGLEVYIAGCTQKYVTITGDAWTPGLDLEERGEQLAVVLEKYMQRPAERPTPPPTPAPSVSDLDDLDLIERAKQSKGGSSFSDLWAGNTFGYNSHSEADMALCNALAWWTNGDAQRVDRLFRQSGLYRAEKWDRPQSGSTYGAITIQNAVITCRGGYEPGRSFGNAMPTDRQETFAPFDPFSCPDLSSLPLFPVDCLPPALRDMANATAESIQVAVDMPAVAELAVAALCVQGKFIISPNPDWTEILSLYAVTVARPSDRKSPTLRACTKHIYDYVREENERRAPLVDEYNMKRTILTKQISGMMDAVAKPTPKGRHPVSTNDIVELQYQLSDLEREKVTPLRLLADDVTPEALVSLMAENGGRMAVVSSEGGIFDIIAGRYSERVNMDVFLKAYSGDRIKIDRKGRKQEEIDCATLTMLLTVQPAVLETIMGNTEFSGRGFLARFLYSIPQSTVGHRRFDVTPISQQIKSQYNSLLDTLLSIPDTGEARTIKLSPEAHAEAHSFFDRLEARLLGDLSEVEDWAGKYQGNTIRIAGILHCCRHGKDAAKQPVSLDTMKQAQTIGEYFLAHALGAFRVMGLSEPQEEKEAKYIWKRLQTVDTMEITKRDLFNLCKGRFEKVESMEPGLSVLIARGYIREEDGQTGERGRPSKKLYVNPESKKAAGGVPA